jgi:chromosome partitioning protein
MSAFGGKADSDHPVLIARLCTLLQLPSNDRARRRTAARAEWFAAANTPLDVSDVLA